MSTIVSGGDGDNSMASSTPEDIDADNVVAVGFAGSAREPVRFRLDAEGRVMVRDIKKAYRCRASSLESGQWEPKIAGCVRECVRVMCTLEPHQVECVRWMAAREEGGRAEEVAHVRGGILADRMGTGKTHMVAALMARRPVPTLVIATIGTLDHWFETLRRHGLHPCRVLSRDHAARLGKGSVEHSSTVVTVASAFVGRPGREHPTAVAEMFARSWGRVVLDEAHVIRNPSTQLHRALKRLNAAVIAPFGRITLVDLGAKQHGPRKSKARR